MIGYEIKIKDEDPIPVVVFEERKYDLVGTFLLAEARSFSREILSALDEVCVEGKTSGGFAGNVFSLEIAPDMTKVTDDIMGRECEIPTRELKEVVEAYRKSL